jgi:hypothetical protein
MKIKRALALALSLLGFAVVSPAVMAEDANKQVAAAPEAKADPTLEGYAAVSTALYKDDLAAAKVAAGGIVKQDKDGTMVKHALGIADSKDLDEARMHFKELSDAAIPVAKAEKTMHRMHCPMAMDGKGADWLQTSADEVQNPYMGAAMPHCGKAVK